MLLYADLVKACRDVADFPHTAFTSHLTQLHRLIPHGDLATSNGEHLGSHMLAGIREQIHHHRCHIFGLAHVLHSSRNACRHTSASNRRNQVGSHAIARQPQCGTACQPHDARFGSGIVGLRHAASVGARSESHQRTARLLLAHDRRGMTENREVPLQVHPHYIVELFLGHVEKHPLAQDSCHAHGSVDGTPLLHGGAHGSLSHCHLRNIARHAHCLASCCFNFGDHRVGDFAGGFATVLLHSVIANHDPCSLSSTSQGHSPADATPCARNDDIFAFQMLYS